MRATRHNGRSGKNGTYNPKHNDRDFNIENSEHIDAEMLNRLIKQIVVHEDIDPDGTRNISLEIHYNFRPVDDSIKHSITNNTGEGSSSLVV